MNLKHVAMLLTSAGVLGACLAVPSANAVGRGPAGNQVECDEVVTVCMSMGLSYDYCKAIEMIACSGGGGDDGGNQP
jgi:hypothetical protein